jgi:GNAT superfamily N-acetyltransferase
MVKIEIVQQCSNCLVKNIIETNYKMCNCKLKSGIDMRQMDLILTAISRRKSIGYLELSMEKTCFTRSLRPQIITIEKIYVVPSFRRQGIASLLMETVKKIIDKMASVELYVSPFEIDAAVTTAASASSHADADLKKFYQRHGFVSAKGNSRRMIRNLRFL